MRVCVKAQLYGDEKLPNEREGGKGRKRESAASMFSTSPLLFPLNSSWRLPPLTLLMASTTTPRASTTSPSLSPTTPSLPPSPSPSPSPQPISDIASFDTADDIYDLTYSESHDSLRRLLRRMLMLYHRTYNIVV